jgi:hypothetical protein
VNEGPIEIETELATKANPLMRDCIEAAVILSGRFED